jgi:hypothetical protein
MRVRDLVTQCYLASGGSADVRFRRRGAMTGLYDARVIRIRRAA